MKFAFDIHGCIDSMPKLFSFLSNLLVDNGCEVHILTGSIWTDKVEEELKNYGIKYTHHFSITDHHLSIGTKMRYDEGTGNPWINTGDENQDNILWDKSKAEYCEKHKIDLCIDDTTRYNDYFTTPFARLWTHSNHPKSAHRDKRHLD